MKLTFSGPGVPALMRSGYYWGVLALAQAVIIVPRAYTVDNHKLLLLYWTIALGVTTRAPSALQFNARWLIGLCFAFAFLWKVGRGEYYDGSFLHYSMATDSRFDFFSHWLCGAPLHAAWTNQAQVSEVLWGASSELTLLDGPRSSAVATILSWWTLLLEGFIATAFLIPSRTRFSRFRNVLLLIFVLSTYAIAPVIGFAWLLLLMGFAQALPNEAFSKTSYLVVLVVTQIFLIPWGQLLTTT